MKGRPRNLDRAIKTLVVVEPETVSNRGAGRRASYKIYGSQRNRQAEMIFRQIACDCSVR